MKRKEALANKLIYHIYNRSIAKYNIFNDNFDYQRMVELFRYFQVKEPPTKFSYFVRLKEVKLEGFFDYFNLLTENQQDLVQIIAYCLMPTHIHLILQQLLPNGISIYMSNVLNSYARYFNTKHRRKGPLRESRFQNRLVENDEQLLHLIRYLYLNPVTAHLVDNPDKWDYSSYNEYFGDNNLSICRLEGLINIGSKEFRKFILDQITYQRELAIIKKQIID